tara:strand:+ start:332 stop:484 length:153 start_codon:yes stop_codon:yes gene_type:complete
MSRKKFFISLLKQILEELKNGGARRDRTADLNTASVALSQLSYSPKKLGY